MRWLTLLLLPAGLAAVASLALAPQRSQALHTVGSCPARATADVVQSGTAGAGGGKVGTTPGKPNVTETTPRGPVKAAPPPASEPDTRPAPAEPSRESRPAEANPAPAPNPPPPERRPEPEAEAPRPSPRLDDQPLSRGGLPLEPARQPDQASRAAPAAAPAQTFSTPLPVQTSPRLCLHTTFGGCRR